MFSFMESQDEEIKRLENHIEWLIAQNAFLKGELENKNAAIDAERLENFDLRERLKKYEIVH